jgi:D-lactate dehydrogenase
VTGAARGVFAEELVPTWLEQTPRAAPPLPQTDRRGAAAVYVPSCVNRIFGPPDGRGRAESLPAALVEVSRRAGMPLWIPDDVAGTCCATPWGSKGYAAGAAWMANHTIDSLWRWSDEGRLPVVCDASSCTLGLAAEMSGLSEENAERHGKLEILDSIAWAQRLLPALTVHRKVASATVHPACAVRHLGLARELAQVAAELADEVVVPPSATCCGFAGDRGFLHPELTESATRDEAAQVAARPTESYVCSNRTCEVGLTRGTGERYESFVYLLEEATRP